MKEEREPTHLLRAESLSPKGGMHSRAIDVVFIMIQQINPFSQAVLLNRT